MNCPRVFQPSNPPSRRPWLNFLCLGIVTAAHAHPGPHSAGTGPGHFVTSPDHAILLAVASFLLCYVARLVPQRLPRRCLDGAGLLAAIVAVAVIGPGR